jgi:hypothetical protein
MTQSAIVLRMPRPKGPPTTQVLVRVPTELVKPLKARAADEGRSVSAHIVQLVRHDLALAERRAKRTGGE